MIKHERFCFASNFTLIGTTGTFAVNLFVVLLPTVNVNRTNDKYFDPPTGKCVSFIKIWLHELGLYLTCLRCVTYYHHNKFLPISVSIVSSRRYISSISLWITIYFKEYSFYPSISAGFIVFILRNELC